MKPHPSDKRSTGTARRDGGNQPARESPDDTGAPKTRSARLGAAADVARQILGGLDAGRLHDLTERYRGHHGDGAWEHIISVLPKWRADPQLITGYQAEHALELLPGVLNDAERLEIARAVWDEQYTGVHEYIDLGSMELTDHLESMVRRRVAAAIARPPEQSASHDQIHDILRWLCAGSPEGADSFVKRLQVTELGKAINPIRKAVRAMKTEIGSRADGWSGNVEQRIRSGPSTFDIALHKTEPVKLAWHVNAETARALRTSTIENTTTDAGNPAAEALPALPGSTTATGTEPGKNRRPGWLRRLTDQLRPRRRDDGAPET